jgi:hypothetical protein
MAFSITELANYSEISGSAVSKTTSSLSIPANSVILVFGHGTYNATDWDHATMFVSDSVNSTTGWVGLDSQITTSNLGNGSGGRLFYRSFTGSATLTITVGRNTGTVYWGYSIVAITGHDTANPIVQAKGAGTYWNDAGNSHTQSVTLSASPTSGNAVITFLGCNNDTGGAATQPTGFTALDLPSGFNFENASVAYHTSTTAATVTWPDCGQQIETAVEFVAEVLLAGGGGGGGANTATTAWLTA